MYVFILLTETLLGVFSILPDIFTRRQVWKSRL